MNPTLKAMMAADLETHFADQAETATIMTQANVPVVATASAFVNEDVDDMGRMGTADLSLVVRLASLTITPTVAGLVTFRTRAYRISGIATHGDLNAITLMLQAVTQ